MVEHLQPEDTAVWPTPDAFGVAYLHTCAVVGGFVRCVGFNSSGQLGDGTTVHDATPDDVIGVSEAVTVAGAKFHSCALARAGSLTQAKG